MQLIAAGGSHTCAATGAGLLCWGANESGQLGIGSFSPGISTPSSPVLTGVSFLALGGKHSCAIQTDSLSCWGANGAKEIDGSGADQNTPRGLSSGINAVATGSGHICGVTKDGGIRCWGLNDQQQLGGAGGGQSEVAVAISSVQAIAAEFKHTCAIADGRTLCWGLNDRGQLGADPHTLASTATPTPVSGR